jgi:hypothetical protein
MQNEMQQGRLIISSILTQENEQKLTITVTSHGSFKRRCRSVRLQRQVTDYHV